MQELRANKICYKPLKIYNTAKLLQFVVFSKNYKDENKKKNRAVLHPVRRTGNHYSFRFGCFGHVHFHNQKPSNIYLTMTQNQTNFLNSNGIMTQRQVNIEKFEHWMKNVIRNVHAYDNGKMIPAYDRID